MTPKHFLYAESDGVGTLTLNRPERLNALTFDVYAELPVFLRWLDTRPSCRVLVITGAGKAFCSGGDVEDIIGNLFARDMKGLLDFTRMTVDVVRAIRNLRKPVIGALNGTTCGAGAAIALACDFRVASDTARCAFLFTKVGLSGADMGACFLLPRVVGWTKATELLMTGDFITALEAHKIGLYNEVLPAQQLMPRVAELAARLCKGPQFGLMMTKELLNKALDFDLETALEAEAQAQAICMQHPDFRESYTAWKEKREPKFG
ncbi:MAG: enoyl-CoA hydratase family protein [Planctomycetes bacterium]|jgi:enoyl-CoA hydratase/carnithine racemase|nr:enoyl-CoA hydratase family protein [Planctomycetota bacterium]MCL4731109.1 enoyl-CoA hydratase family protein [Planctomycetota bacterium]